eukprot:TRINITY_DN56574_c0_g2_i1.p1 TRINITY_DN56574_c0_g2~~TRINITY_DN56574_c0_g2_i1.p1  ORF type:complete len:276 (-),score=32.79 TRINITY_DN56574_c0_g2_i1:48-875(-)
MDVVARLRLLDWQWLIPPVEKKCGKLSADDRDVLLTELFRFIAIKVLKDDLDSCNKFSPTGVVDDAFHVLLLNPYFCLNMMKLIDKPGQVLSHVPAERADHADRVCLYMCHYEDVFGCAPAATFPSGLGLWPQLRRKRTASAATVQNHPPVRRQRNASLSAREAVDAPGGGKIFVRTLTGRTIGLHFENFRATFHNFRATRVKHVADEIQNREGIPSDQQQTLTLNGEQVVYPGGPPPQGDPASLLRWQGQVNKTLREVGIQSESTLHLALVLRC